jgi:hypothetical protein
MLVICMLGFKNDYQAKAPRGIWRASERCSTGRVLSGLDAAHRCHAPAALLSARAGRRHQAARAPPA